MPSNSSQESTHAKGCMRILNISIVVGRMHIFNSAAKGIEDVLKRKMHPGNRVQNKDALVSLRFAKGPGVEGRPNTLFWNHYAATWLRAHIEQPICPETGISCNFKWIPNFEGKPAPIWKPGAPCGFIAAAKHVTKQEALMKQEHRWKLV